MVYEYSFLKEAEVNCKFFVGSDTPVLRGKRLFTSPHRLNNDYEEVIKNRCSLAENYSDLIITSKVDQVSYFTRDTHPFIYFYPDKDFYKNEKKYQNVDSIKIVHAPSSPVIKGTQLVRSAISKLKNENYLFEYIELINFSNTEIKHHLKTAHIVLNEFYAHMPGIFGVEALANFCALMTSADEYIETDLPQDSNKAWMVTKNYESTII